MKLDLVMSYLVAMGQLVTIQFALMRPDQVKVFVFLKEFVGNIRSEIGACTSESVGDATLGSLRVRPQDVEDLWNVT